MKILSTSLFLFFTLSLISQSGIYFGAKIAQNRDYQLTSSENNKLESEPVGIYFRRALYSYELNIGYQFNDLFDLEAGIISKSYYIRSPLIREVGGFKIGSFGLSYGTIQIPIRFKAKLNLLQNRFYLTPIIGYSITYNNRHKATGESGGTSTVNDIEIKKFSTSDYGLQKVFGLMESGLGLEAKIYKGLSFNVQTSYYASFGKPVSRTSYKYIYEGASESNYTTYSNGNYFSASFGIKYLLKGN